MAISACSNRVNEQGMEMIEHGTALFPIACYHDDLTWEGVPWHWHEEFEALLVTEGCALAETDTQQFIVRKGQGCLVNVNVLHSMRNTHPGENCRFHSMCFHPRLSGGSAESIFWEKYVYPVTGNHACRMLLLTPGDPVHSSLLERIERVWQSCANEPEDYEIRIRYDLSMLFAQTAKLMPGKDEKVHRRDAVREERMKAMLAYIHQNLETDLHVSDIGKAANISESECLRTFREITRVTPMRYVMQLRMQKAAEMLKNTDLPVSEIGSACGFMDMSYFSRVFRASYGVSATAYRRAMGTGRS